MPFFAIGAALLGPVIGGIAGGAGASSAANDQEQAANNATAAQLQMFNQTQANEAPYMAAGGNALAALQQGLGLGAGGTGQGSLNTPFSAAQYQQSPGYAFQMQQGEQAIQDTASAHGGVMGGNTLKALTQYGQGLANTDYQQALNNYMAQQNQQFSQLQTLAGSGQNAAANLGALGSQTATNIGNNDLAAGNAASAGAVGISNSIGSAANGLGSNYLLASLLNGGGASGATSAGAFPEFY